MTLAQKAYAAHIDSIQPEGILVTDVDLVEANSLKEGIIHYCESFNKIAIEELKKKAVTNMIMLGYLQEKTKIVTFDALEKAVADLVPPKTIDLNLKAIQMGVNISKLNQ